MENCYKYLYNNEATKVFIQNVNRSNKSKKEIKTIELEDAIILPAKASAKCSWGIGGVVDKNGTYIPESGIRYHFGGIYEFDKENIITINETVIYISVIPKHWGHFLLDVVGRLWYALDKPFIKIAYCSADFGEDGITGSFLEFFELLGFSREKLIYVNRPMKFSKVIIPERTMTSHHDYDDYSNYLDEYKDVIKKVIDNFLEEGGDYHLPVYKNIYFTRTKIPHAKYYYDTGEKEIERVFEINGFTIISPEKLTLREQLYYISNCDRFVSLSGTIAHNAMFAKNATEIVILNRTGITNIAQVRLNECFEIPVTYVDVYHRGTQNEDYGLGPFWVEVNENLINYLRDNDMKVIKSGMYVDIRNAIKYASMKLIRIKFIKNLLSSIKKKIKH